MPCRSVISRCLLACSLLHVALAAQAQWQLDPAASSLQFVSIKNTAVGEVHSFKALSGAISDEGEARVEIDLASVESLIPIRNERMREMLFETAKFPVATILAPLEPGQIEALADRQRHSMTLPVQLSLHGFEQSLSVALEVVRVKDRLYVYSPGPVMLDAADFGLDAGIEKLREVAGLKAISTAVPVTFSLQFSRGD